MEEEIKKGRMVDGVDLLASPVVPRAFPDSSLSFNSRGRCSGRRIVVTTASQHQLGSSKGSNGQHFSLSGEGPS